MGFLRNLVLSSFLLGSCSSPISFEPPKNEKTQFHQEQDFAWFGDLNVPWRNGNALYDFKFSKDYYEIKGIAKISRFSETDKNSNEKRFISEIEAKVLEENIPLWGGLTYKSKIKINEYFNLLFAEEIMHSHFSFGEINRRLFVEPIKEDYGKIKTFNLKDEKWVEEDFCMLRSTISLPIYQLIFFPELLESDRLSVITALGGPYYSCEEMLENKKGLYESENKIRSFWFSCDEIQKDDFGIKDAKYTFFIGPKKIDGKTQEFNFELKRK